ncbi:hypothetical protein L665_04144 [Ralstonia solanacearum SD54]|nr:hypothetical protein F504_2925 [Ralstonia pseudosolanacearum FQY_4]ARU20835.1 hypothetical protein RSSE_c0396 [Ralstonia solanacearum]ESS48950.1 hypothetical protein L665_04144 [Ralstonia solanacearum SD54]
MEEFLEHIASFYCDFWSTNSIAAAILLAVRTGRSRPSSTGSGRFYALSPLRRGCYV